MNQDLINCVANDNGWEFAEPQPDKNYNRFVKDGNIIDIWHTGTVRKIINNKASHYRDNSEEDIIKLFK